MPVLKVGLDAVEDCVASRPFPLLSGHVVTGSLSFAVMEPAFSQRNSGAETVVQLGAVGVPLPFSGVAPPGGVQVTSEAVPLVNAIGTVTVALSTRSRTTRPKW